MNTFPHPRHSDLDLTFRQLKLRDLCDEIAEHDGINTFHWKCIFNDGTDCEYEYLNEDGTIYSVELLRDHGAALVTYDITVQRNLRDDDGDRTNVWVIESESEMVAESGSLVARHLTPEVT